MTIYVELGGRSRIHLQAPWRPGLPQKCKEVAGASWVKTEKVWSYPLSMDTCRQLRTVFGEELEIGPLLTEWARLEVKRERELMQLNRQSTGALTHTEVLSPRLARAMATRPYQIAGARFIAAGRKVADFDEPGLGKTATAIAGIMEAGLWEPGRKFLVIAPKTAVQATWPREFSKWTDDAQVYAMTVDGEAKRKEIIHAALQPNDKGPVFLVVNPNMLQIKMVSWCKKCALPEADIIGEQYDIHLSEQHKCHDEIVNHKYPELQGVTWDGIVADECHKYLLRLRPAVAAKKQPQWAQGLMRLQTTEDGIRLPMTGTPFRGKEQSMFGPLYWMNPKRYSSFWAWADSFLQITENDFGYKEIGRLRSDREKEFDISLSTQAIRRTRHEVRSELPDQVFMDHWVTLEGKHAKQYNEFVEAGEAELDSGMLIGNGVLSELTRARQLAFGVWDAVDGGKPFIVGPSPKVALLLDMLDERGVNKESETLRKEGKGDPEALKYIVASQWTEILDYVEEQLNNAGIETVSITGKSKNRSDVVDQFQSFSGTRVLLLSTTAGGESITLDRYCEEMFILDETFVEDDLVQLRGRIDNRGDRVATRIYHYIRTEGTVEESIAQGNYDQSEMQAALLDRRRGVEVAKRLLAIPERKKAS